MTYRGPFQSLTFCDFVKIRAVWATITWKRNGKLQSVVAQTRVLSYEEG